MTDIYSRKGHLAEVDTLTAFKNFQIDSSDFLDEVEGREKCPRCTRSRKFYCYTCFIPMSQLKDRIPQVTLPLKVTIVKHPLEIDGKSTAAHAALLSPDSVEVLSYPALPDTETSILVFPSPDAEDTEEFMNRMKSENTGSFPYDRVIFIDCTWNQTNKVWKDQRFSNLPKVKLSGIESLFWRYHVGNPSTHLATIEAVYYFFRIYHRVYGSQPYSGQFDNLLFFFRYMFNKIREMYGSHKLKAYTKRPYLPE